MHTGMANHALYPMGQLGTGVISVGVFRLVIIYHVDQHDTLGQCVQIIKPPLRLDQPFSGSIWLVDDKFIPFGTIIGDMELLAYRSQGQDIGNAIRVVPYHSISTEIAHEICPGYPCITVDVHPTIRFMNVFLEGDNY